MSIVITLYQSIHTIALPFYHFSFKYFSWRAIDYYAITGTPYFFIFSNSSMQSLKTIAILLASISSMTEAILFPVKSSYFFLFLKRFQFPTYFNPNFSCKSLTCVPFPAPDLPIMEITNGFSLFIKIKLVKS